MFSHKWLICVRPYGSTKVSDQVKIDIVSSGLIQSDEFEVRYKSIYHDCDHRPGWEWNDEQYNQCHVLIGNAIKELIRLQLEASNVVGYNPRTFNDNMTVLRGYFSISMNASVVLIETTDTLMNYLKEFSD